MKVCHSDRFIRDVYVACTWPMLITRACAMRWQVYISSLSEARSYLSTSVPVLINVFMKVRVNDFSWSFTPIPSLEIGRSRKKQFPKWYSCCLACLKKKLASYV